MIPRDRTPLYSPQLLSLAVELARYPLDADAPHRGSARSRTCGSIVEVGLACDADGRIARVGLQVTACAVGQAAAAIFAEAARGRDEQELVSAKAQVERWLAGGPMPQWPRIEHLEPALPHKGRHEAILLPWRAATDALCKAPSGG